MYSFQTLSTSIFDAFKLSEMHVIVTVHLFYCPNERSKIAFSSFEDGHNIPLKECESWMHWKTATIAGDINEPDKGYKVTDARILKALIADGYLVSAESSVETELGLY